MRNSIFLIAVIFASALSGAEMSARFSKRIGAAEDAYKAAVQKADTIRSASVHKASQERDKVLKAALVEATKAGDFDTATDIKARMPPPDLRESITAGEWQSPKHTWGRFVLKSDGTAEIESWKGRIRWMALDDHTIVISGKNDDGLWVDTISMNKERTKLIHYVIGRRESPNWEAVRVPAQK